MTDLYLTSTFTNEWNRGFNPKIGEALEKAGLVCYLPHRDTDQKSGHSNVFASDIKAIDTSRCILAIALNESPNWGAELGYGYALGKPIIVLTDKNHVTPLICNGMVKDSLRVENLDDIDLYIGELVELVKNNI